MRSQKFNANLIRESIQSKRLYLTIVQVTGDPEISTDKSYAGLECEDMLRNDLCFCSYTIGAIQKQPKKMDLWIACFINEERTGKLNSGYLLNPLVFDNNKLHDKVAMEDSSVFITKKGKKIYLTDDLESALEENMVLGQKFKTYIKETLSEINTRLTTLTGQVNTFKTAFNAHTHVAPLAGTTSPPAVPQLPGTAPQVTTANTDSKIDPTLSDFVFTRDKKS